MTRAPLTVNTPCFHPDGRWRWHQHMTPEHWPHVDWARRGTERVTAELNPKQKAHFGDYADTIRALIQAGF